MLVAVTAQKFGCRPSSLVGLGDSVLALDFDLAAAARLLDMERAARQQANPDFEEVPSSSRAARSVDW